MFEDNFNKNLSKFILLGGDVDPDFIGQPLRNGYLCAT